MRVYVVALLAMIVLASVGRASPPKSRGDVSPLERIVGIWDIDPSDKDGPKNFGQITEEFTGDGTLRHTIHVKSGDQIMLLTYRIEGDYIITDQPSHPREERSRFSFTSDGKLVLELSGQRARYVRRQAEKR